MWLTQLVFIDLWQILNSSTWKNPLIIFSIVPCLCEAKHKNNTELCEQRHDSPPNNRKLYYGTMLKASKWLQKIQIHHIYT